MLIPVGVYRPGVLQHVHDLPVHNASALVNVEGCARRSAVVRSGHTVDQSPDFGNDTGTYGVRRSYRRHLHLVERNLRRQRSLPRIRQLLHEQVGELMIN